MLKQWPGLIARKTDANQVTWVLEETAHMFFREAESAKVRAECAIGDLKAEVMKMQTEMRDLNRKCREMKEAIRNRDWGYGE